MAGAVSGGIAEGIFVADVGEFGTIGDLLGGPTALDHESMMGEENKRSEKLLTELNLEQKELYLQELLEELAPSLNS